MEIFLIYIFVISIVTFFVYGADKNKARKGQWRIPENVLIALAAIGGSIGALIGMRYFHHKTKKPKFYVGVPAILVVQVILLILVLYFIYFQ